MGKFGFFSYIGPTCYVSGMSRWNFGNKVRIYPFARIESLGGIISIGNDVSIGQNLHLISMNNVIVGNKTTISSSVFISDVDHEYEEVGSHIMAQKLSIKKTIIGDNCFIGYGAAILPGTILGKQNIIGANSVVKGVFPVYCVIAGNPAKIIKRYDPIDLLWKKTDVNGSFI